MRRTAGLCLATAIILTSAVAIGGETTPASQAPEFKVRGTLPWHNFLSGPSAWNEEDYRAYLDGLAARRLNFVGFHCYTGGAERYAPYVEPIVRIQYRDVVPEATFDTSLTARWGYRPLAVKDFAFGTGKLFELPKGAVAFGARCAVTAGSREEHYRQAHDLMRQVLQMAHERGLRMAIGFEFGIHPPELASIVPPGSRIPGAMLPDPTHPANIEILQSALDDVVQEYPGLDYVWLWLHEHTMYIGKTQLAGPFGDLYRKESKHFADAGDEAAVFTGVWSLAHLRQAHAHLARRAPKVRLIVGGWGGGPQLPSVLRGLDRALPPDVIFTCLNPGLGQQGHVPVLAEIAKHREVWSIPWLEGDGSLWHLQPRVSLMLDQVKAARRDGLAGVLGILWRTEEIRANLDAFARAASSPGQIPSVEDFYREDCLRQYGPTSKAELAPLLARMDREQWLAPLSSPEFFPYDPGWGRLSPSLAERLRGVVRLLSRIQGETVEPKHQANLQWLADNFRFTLLLDEVGRKIEPAYRLKEQWLKGEVNDAKLASEARTAQKQLVSAPVEELFHTFARRIRSRGEQGELSALNQKLWLQVRELEGFLARTQAAVIQKAEPEGPEPSPQAAAPSRSAASHGSRFLFSYFRGNGEDGLHLASSRNGYHWSTLNHDRSLLTPQVGSKLMRDPCLVQGPNGVFHLVWTTGWSDRVIGYASSRDLVRWSPQQAIPVMTHEPAARNAWAPELFYDEDQKRFLIFWATTIPGRFTETDRSGDDGWNHRIYATTTSDFKTFTPTRLLFDGGFNVIDATILKARGQYYLIVKDETKTPVKKNLRIACSAKAEGPYKEVSAPISTSWVEGPSAIQIGEEFLIYFDHYAAPQYYGALRSSDLVHWEDISPKVEFPKGTRHGAVLRVSEEVMARLQ